MFPARCSRDTFLNKFFDKNIGAFRLAGYFTWNEEAAGSNPVSYTELVLKRFVGVTANITDCRSVAMSSILIRTAEVIAG